MQFFQVQTFDQWRDVARHLVATETPPSEVHWTDDNQPTLMQMDSAPPTVPTKSFSVPKRWLEIARTVACHRDASRWELMYRVLWRLTHGEKKLLDVPTDEDVYRIEKMVNAVRRDAHKMKAFVRFRRIVRDDQEHFIAWHRPDHRIVRLVAPFFARRFPTMNWSILTPHESVHWDQSELAFGPGIPASEAPKEDELESLWLTYYASIFNPSRVKVEMMKSEMPVRHWPTLPETELIPELLLQASQRVNQMVTETEGFEKTAAYFLPPEQSLPALNAAASKCTACALHCDATQTVFGAGSEKAEMMLVGEQPGDREDREGKPFVGPAGDLLDQVLRRLGCDRDQLYITNVVKHFKHTERGGRRLHQKPDSREIFACRPWLESELELVAPARLVCLGATAAQAILGRDFRITQQRGKWFASDWCQQTIATWHPAAILRMQDVGRREQMQQQFESDLRRALAT